MIAFGQLNKTRVNALTAVLFMALTTLGSQTSANQVAGSEYIVGGASITTDDTPGVAALINKPRLDESGNFFAAQFCSGVLLQSRWIVTSAHCVFDRNTGVEAASDILALVGSTDLTQPVTQSLAIAEVLVHPGYEDNSTWQQDIALLRLAVDTPQAPAVLDTSPRMFNDAVFLAGWGATRNDPISFPTLLHGVALRLIPGDQCGSAVPDLENTLDNSQLCAQSRDDNPARSCFNDTGGPLYRIDAQGQANGLVGITSGGARCEETALFTNVASYLDWISTSTGGDITLDGAATDTPSTSTSTSSGGGSVGWLILLFALSLVRLSTHRRLIRSP